jgi:Sulfite exporter TauE/SafE
MTAAELLVPPLAPATLAYSLCVVFAAGIVRGFAGFGFSAITVAGMSLVVSPALVVPAIFMLEVLASLSQLRGIARDIDMPWLSWLMLGNLICIPVGVALLAWLPETPLRLLIGALLMSAALLLRAGARLTLVPTRGVRLSAGLASGFINGVAAIGGIAIAVLLSTAKMANGQIARHADRAAAVQRRGVAGLRGADAVFSACIRQPAGAGHAEMGAVAGTGDACGHLVGTALVQGGVAGAVQEACAESADRVGGGECGAVGGGVAGLSGWLYLDATIAPAS